MKFVCDNCQAKYQIGDDKVAGKTVRMKCRKCGYSIKVSAAPSAGVPDGPAGESPSYDAPAADRIPAPPVSALQAVTPHAARPAVTMGETPKPPARPVAPAGPAEPARAGWSEGDDESTSIMNAPVQEAVAAALAARAPTAPERPVPIARPAAAPAPRPVTTGLQAPRAVMGAPAPRPPPAAQPRPVTRQSTMGAASPTAARSGISSSSAAAVHQEHPQHAPLQPAPAAHAAHAELEWYVGIGGSPIGPVRVAVIRERAAAHEVDGESLVWREGLSEWLPLRTFPELLEVVTAATAPARVERLPTPTPFAAMAALSAPAGAPAHTGAAYSPAPVAAAAAAAPVAATPAPVAAAPPVAATPAPIAAAPAPVQAHADPFSPAPSPFAGSAAPVTPLAVLAPLVAPNGAPKANGLHLANGMEAVVPADAPRSPGPAVAPKPAAAPLDIDPALEAAGVPRRSNTHPMAYAFIAAAAVFGGVAAYVLLSKPPPPPIVVVQAPSTTPAPSGAPKAVPDDKGAIEVGDPLAVVEPSSRPALGKPWPKTSATASAAAHDSAPLDTSGFVPNVPGPQATAPSGPSAGGQLSQGEMNGVVAQNQPRIKRRCWEPALAGQSANGPKSARVTVAISINASGGVDSASASGADSFPGLASCIGGMVKGWRFPPSGGSTSVNVPFTFVGQ